MLFSYFRFFAIPCLRREFECNGGFAGVLSKKFEAISTEDGSFGTGSNAAVYVWRAGLFFVLLVFGY